eukprot:CAMPEP_0115832582 /NCGR_PEP_ID=MMETSP0287-20121206/2733_1 /TAXON_ID=412157 /ORGANISM="Chrysochromulina rotalis, Strain UIO044" /LENGTH=63 /DNA_ID=CAMNT_0003285973 /DNA_START=360 /DNA_END=552 /DNA_ORIENTATION=-
MSSGAAAAAAAAADASESSASAEQEKQHLEELTRCHPAVAGGTAADNSGRAGDCWLKFRPGAL